METSTLERDSARIIAVNALLNYLAAATPNSFNSSFDPSANEQAETLELNITFSIAAKQAPPAAVQVVPRKPGMWRTIWRTLEDMSA